MREFLIGVVICCLSAELWAQGYPPDQSVQKMTLPTGLEATLFASEPQVRQPIFCKCDDRGRLWTIQYLQYPNPAGLKRVKVDRYSRTVYDRKPEPPPHGPQGADRITILEDTDGDGRADRVKDFVAGLNLCTGLEFGYGGVFVLQVPYLLFYPDRDGDDVPDTDPQVLLDGFGMEDAQSLANHLTWGPDGWLYGLNGSTTTCNIEGIEFQQGVWRYHPVTRRFELFCEGGGNVFGLTFDRQGRLFYSSNGGLFWHGVQGGYYEKNFGKHGPLHNLYAYGFLKSVQHEGDPGRPNTGATIYLGDSFPAEFRDAFLCGDFLAHTCSYWKVTPRGSTVSAKLQGLLLNSHDTWFGATDLCLGPDGAVYVCDFHDQRTAHPDPDARWDTSNGRIYRLQAKDHQPAAPIDLVKQTTPQLVELLGHRNGWYAQRARRILAERNDSQAAPLLADLVFNNPSHDLALQAVWALHGVAGLDSEMALRLLEHPSEHVRAWTVRLLGDARVLPAGVTSRLRDLAESEVSPVVRSQLAASVRRLPGPQAVALIVALLARDSDADDPYLPWQIWWAIADCALGEREKLLQQFCGPSGWGAKLLRENQPRLIRRYAAEGARVGYESCAELLDAAPPESHELMWRGLLQGLTERARSLGGVGVSGLFDSVAGAAAEGVGPVQAKPVVESVSGRLREMVESLWRSRTEDPLAVRLALESGIEEARQQLPRRLERDEPAAVRRETLALLVEYPDDAALPALVALLKSSRDEAALPEVLQAIRPFVNDQVVDVLLSRYPSLSASAQSRTRDVLFARPASALAFLRRVDSLQIPAESVPVEQLRPLALFQNSEVDALVRRHWGNIQPGTPEEKLADIRRFTNDLRAGSGDAGRGRGLFEKHCGTCHKLRGEGGLVGPDLSNTVKGDLVSLLANIVDPSAVVRREFLAYMAVTKSGLTVTGLLLEEDAGSVTLVDAKGQKTRLLRDQLDELAESPVSLMPERLLEQLSPQELRDLFRYLRQ